MKRINTQPRERARRRVVIPPCFRWGGIDDASERIGSAVLRQRGSVSPSSTPYRHGRSQDKLIAAAVTRAQIEGQVSRLPLRPDGDDGESFPGRGQGAATVLPANAQARRTNGHGQPRTFIPSHPLPSPAVAP